MLLLFKGIKMKILILIILFVVNLCLLNAKEPQVLDKKTKLYEYLPKIENEKYLSKNNKERLPEVNKKVKIEISNFKRGENEENSYDTKVFLSYELKNNYDKQIKQIKGRVIINDLLDENVVNLIINPDIYLDANKSKIINGYYTVSKNARILFINQEDVKIILDIKKIALEDNTVITFEELN